MKKNKSILAVSILFLIIFSFNSDIAEYGKTNITNNFEVNYKLTGEIFKGLDRVVPLN